MIDPKEKVSARNYFNMDYDEREKHKRYASRRVSEHERNCNCILCMDHYVDTHHFGYEEDPMEY